MHLRHLHSPRRLQPRIRMPMFSRPSPPRLYPTMMVIAALDPFDVRIVEANTVSAPIPPAVLLLRLALLHPPLLLHLPLAPLRLSHPRVGRTALERDDIAHRRHRLIRPGHHTRLDLPLDLFLRHPRVRPRIPTPIRPLRRLLVLQWLRP